MANKGRDGVFIAFEEVPLADFPTGHQPGALEGGQMRRHGGLRQPGALVELPGADADGERLVLLLVEIALRLLQPAQHVAPHGVGQGLEDLVEVQCFAHRCLCVYRLGTNYISVKNDMNSFGSMMMIDGVDSRRVVGRGDQR